MPTRKGYMGGIRKWEVQRQNKATVQTEPDKTLELSDVLSPEETIVYSRWLHLMNRSGVDYAVGGGFALFAYTGIWRSTKDLDIFLKPVDLKKVLDFMTDAGYDCEVTYPVWIAKVQRGPYCMDLIFGGNFHGNRVDDLVLSRRRPARLLETPTHLMAPEALFASKAHISGRGRRAGACRCPPHADRCNRFLRGRRRGVSKLAK